LQVYKKKEKFFASLANNRVGIQIWK